MFTGIKLWIMLIAASVILASVTVYIHGAEKAKAQNKVLEAKNQQLNLDLKQSRKDTVANQKAAEQCVIANIANAQEASRQTELARIAARKIEDLEIAANTRAGAVDNEATILRGRDTGCRSLHDPNFPDWFITWVRQ